MEKTAVVFGATGLIGGNCVKQLLENDYYDKILLFVRRPLNFSDPRVIQHIIDFNDLEKDSHLIKGTHLFYCIGTTRKKAGSKEEFIKVDFSYTQKVASIASENGVEKFLLISSIGANKNSGNFYLSVKGKVEEEIKKYPFRAVHIFRPSFLVGEREENRPGETIAYALMRFLSFFGGPVKVYKPIEASTVAASMIRHASLPENGIFLYESDKIN